MTLQSTLQKTFINLFCWFKFNLQCLIMSNMIRLMRERQCNIVVLEGRLIHILYYLTESTILEREILIADVNYPT